MKLVKFNLPLSPSSGNIWTAMRNTDTDRDQSELIKFALPLKIDLITLTLHAVVKRINSFLVKIGVYISHDFQSFHSTVSIDTSIVVLLRQSLQFFRNVKRYLPH